MTLFRLIFIFSPLSECRNPRKHTVQRSMCRKLFTAMFVKQFSFRDPGGGYVMMHFIARPVPAIAAAMPRSCAAGRNSLSPRVNIHEQRRNAYPC